MIEQWTGFTDALRQVGDKMQARLPARLANDAHTRQEAMRLILAATARELLDVLGSDPSHPTFMPSLNATLNIFQPNADTLYLKAVVSGAGSYRLSGQSGSVRIASLAQFGTLTGEVALTDSPSALQALAHHDLNTLQVDDQGRFEVLLSPERPQEWDGDWWQIEPGTGYLMFRQVAADWTHEQDWRVSIERIDTPVRRSRVSESELSQRLDRLATEIGNTALSFVTRVEDLRSDGYINRMKTMHVPGALQGQFYYEGAFELAPSEALVIEVEVPDTCLYWSMLLVNDIYETIDWVNNQSSLNDTQARVDADGRLRFVLSSEDPGVPNWLDPAGYLCGGFQGRWTGASDTPIPTVTRVPVSAVRDFLPSDTPVITPEQREDAIRQRRRAWQSRPVW